MVGIRDDQCSTAVCCYWPGARQRLMSRDLMNKEIHAEGRASANSDTTAHVQLVIREDCLYIVVFLRIFFTFCL